MRGSRVTGVVRAPQAESRDEAQYEAQFGRSAAAAEAAARREAEEEEEEEEAARRAAAGGGGRPQIDGWNRPSVSAFDHRKMSLRTGARG